jgi:hypothetical protein
VYNYVWKYKIIVIKIVCKSNGSAGEMRKDEKNDIRTNRKNIFYPGDFKDV